MHGLQSVKIQCRQTLDSLLRLRIGPVLSSWGTEREAAGVALQEEGEMGTPSSFKALQPMRAYQDAQLAKCWAAGFLLKSFLTAHGQDAHMDLRRQHAGGFCRSS